MYAAELVELAAILAANGPALLAADAHVKQKPLDEYWTASKCRLDRWQRVLADFRRLAQQSARRPTPQDWRRLVPVIEEILTGEVLTRVWAAIHSPPCRWLRSLDQYSSRLAISRSKPVSLGT